MRCVAVDVSDARDNYDDDEEEEVVVGYGTSTVASPSPSRRASAATSWRCAMTSAYRRIGDVKCAYASNARP